MTVRILQGDAALMLRGLPPASVHCCITSPPYWGLRDYGVDGQIGLEATPEEFVERIVATAREIWRVLRDDGTLWLNLGDSYAGSGRGGNVGNGSSTTAGKQTDHSRSARARQSSRDVSDSQRKNAVTVRGSRLPAGLHQQERHTEPLGRCWVPPPPGLKAKDLVGIPWMVAFALRADGWYLRQDIIWSKPNPMPESVRDRCTKAHEYIFLLSKSSRYFYDADAIAELATHADEARYDNGANGLSSDRSHSGVGTSTRKFRSPASGALKRNRRSVWDVASAPFKDAHFATFPPALIEPAILAGSSSAGCCVQCGAPWVRKPTGRNPGYVGPTCRHGRAAPLACTVLDPFGGAGTTGLVADRLQRDAVLVELNPDYVAIARKRIVGDSPMFAEVAI